MKTLQESITRMEGKGGAGQSLRKHLAAVGINEWEDITKASLYDFHDHLAEALAPGSAKTILAYFKALLHRNEDDLDLPRGWEKILMSKGDTTRGTYLTPAELKAFEAVQTNGAKEAIVKYESLIEAYTGARVSDVMTFTEENFKDGYLTYTSKKTKVTATVPISEKTKGWVSYAQEHREDEPTLAGRNEIIRRLARRAGITAKVKTRRGGVEKVTEKWEVLSSHCFRRSTATNLVMAGASLTEAKVCLGHSSEQMTSRYVVAVQPRLSAKAMAYFL